MVFGFGEKYSREALEREEIKLKSAIDGLKKIEEVGLIDIALSGIKGDEVMQELRIRAERAKNSLERLKNQGQKEATALNEKYDQLLGDVGKALEALSLFEEEKFGRRILKSEKSESVDKVELPESKTSQPVLDPFTGETFIQGDLANTERVLDPFTGETFRKR